MSGGAFGIILSLECEAELGDGFSWALQINGDEADLLVICKLPHGEQKLSLVFKIPPVVDVFRQVGDASHDC